MTGRDRMVLIGIVVVAVLGAVWMLGVSPERQKASQLDAQVAAAQAQLASAEDKVSSARAAQSQYATAYASLVSIGKAVPPSDEVPSLIEELSQASNEKQVDFTSITNGSGSGSSTSSSSSSSSTSSASAAAVGISDEPFSFVFEGNYFDLEHLFSKLTSFATLDSAGNLEVSGRLLTIQSVKLAPLSSGTEPGKNKGMLTGTITATAYVLPAAPTLTGATGGATPTGSTASPAASTTAASSPTSPAIVRVNP
jgi:Type II secretion system (T2SS), protein M